MDKKIEFLYQSIGDIQNTIRAIDVKIGFLFVIAFMPITLIKDISESTLLLWKQYDICKLLISTVFISWIFSILYLFLTLTSISNPTSGIHGSKPQGLFYGDGVFKIEYSFIGSIVKAKSNYTVKEIYDMLPDDSQITNELIYEKMKLTYIREMKFCRYSICTRFIYIWLSLSIGLYFYSLIINH
ncbi:hypothetical protein PEC311524_12610 [Pectobacterium carotovorum subsp. carotovorum]|nr:hypothetical protein PEC311524_12610 [Pectobacterium carotovorum subsp. carotovorum]